MNLGGYEIADKKGEVDDHLCTQVFNFGVLSGSVERCKAL